MNLGISSRHSNSFSSHSNPGPRQFQPWPQKPAKKLIFSFFILFLVLTSDYYHFCKDKDNLDTSVSSLKKRYKTFFFLCNQGDPARAIRAIRFNNEKNAWQWLKDCTDDDLKRADPDTRQPHVIGSKCVGCHLCRLVCPVGAMGLAKRIKK